MSQLLFSFKDRDAAHAKAEEIRKDHPAAECREDPNLAEPYQVWSGAVVRDAEAPDAELNRLREELARLKAGG